MHNLVPFTYSNHYFSLGMGSGAAYLSIAAVLSALCLSFPRHADTQRTRIASARCQINPYPKRNARDNSHRRGMLYRCHCNSVVCISLSPLIISIKSATFKACTIPKAY